MAVKGLKGSDPPNGTEQRVHAAAVRLFAERGFHGTGIRDLAEAAGLSSATLYHYMGTKEELLARLMRESLEHLLAEARSVLASESEPVRRLAGLVRMHVREHAEQRLETTVIDGEIRALRGLHRDEVLALRDAYEALWHDVLAEGRTAGVLDIDDVGLARLALLEMCSGVSRWYSPAGRLSLDDISEQYVVMATRLVGA